MSKLKCDCGAAERLPERAYGTLPEASRLFGIGLKKLRLRVAEGCFPIYMGGTSWPRVKFTEVEEWLRSTRVPIEPEDDDE
jgi:hypothetical protein